MDQVTSKANEIMSSSQPVVWKRRFIRRASLDGVGLSEWIGQACLEYLAKLEGRSLAEVMADLGPRGRRGIRVSQPQSTMGQEETEKGLDQVWTRTSRVHLFVAIRRSGLELGHCEGCEGIIIYAPGKARLCKECLEQIGKGIQI